MRNYSFYGGWSDKRNSWCLFQEFGIFETVIFPCDSAIEAALLAAIANKDQVSLYDPLKIQESDCE